MEPLTTRPRGTEDVLGPVAQAWQYLEQTARRLAGRYGYEEIRTPVFEHTELFVRSAGDTSDIVSKEMYTFNDRGGRSLTLRPEGTAPVVRAFLENRLYAGSLPVKLYYLGPMFRYGRPQAGRLRQFHQFGVEFLGSGEPAADAEVIALSLEFCRELGLEGVELHLNSVGCPRCRPPYREALLAYLGPRQEELCGDCLDRYVRNPLRVFDCKQPGCREVLREAPLITSYLCADCARHWATVKTYLERLGFAYREDAYLVRGLDYYTRTAFELTAAGIGAQNSIGGGGRYDGLVEACGGPAVPAVGFALGMERVLLALEAQGRKPGEGMEFRVFVAVTEGVDRAEAAEVVLRLRRAGYTTEQDYLERSLKAQMKHAARWRAAVTLILGPEELREGKVTLRVMDGGLQEKVALVDLETALEQFRSTP
ncbi:MAG: histidine--tRNA ligase [Clostridia bacterium]|jgi:histidyl-tRNA synthetase|nr:histidine--tRNA ligase [Clostridia bacterium]MDH7572787.1 histidine--tRNA ligase [Clostridia bacterium]